MWESIALIEGQPRDCDRRCPLIKRLFHSGLLSAFTDLGAHHIVHAVGDHGPAVVFSCAGDVDLVPALRAMLVCPELASLRVNCSALNVAMTVREDFRARVLLTDKRIVSGDFPVVVQANHGSGVVIESLCAILCASIAKGEIDHALVCQNDLAAEVMSGIRLWLETKETFLLYQPIALKLAPNQCSARPG